MKIDLNTFIEGLKGMEDLRRVSKEEVLEVLKESMAKAYKKQLGQGFEDINVRVDIDLDGGEINMYEVKKVVKEVNDDALEVELSEAKKENPDYKEGDDYLIPVDIEKLRLGTMMAIKTLSTAKFRQKEKDSLNEEFQGKIKTIVTGRVETFDEKGATVNIGRSTVYLTRKQMIGDETFAPGDQIKVFVNEVASGKQGAHIIVSRSCNGFLEKLFEEEIHDIYDKTVVIKGIAREAGMRSKVAVYSDDTSIDPCGSCIGSGGSKIQKIVNQLGNGTIKEKIDVIAYSEIPGLYIAEALKPAKIVGVDVDEEHRVALVIVKDDSYSVAIGRNGANSRLAAKLTGYSIDIVIESEAEEEGYTYETLEELQAKDLELRKSKKPLLNETVVKERTSVLPGLPEGYVAPQARFYNDEKNDIDEVLEEKVEDEVEEISSVVTPETPVSSVKINTTLADLEASLISSIDDKKETKRTNKKVKKEEEKEEETVVAKVAPEQRMAIYTDEELKEQALEDAEENEEVEEDDVDYDEYDDYYDEK